jgi:hypothetical protein
MFLSEEGVSTHEKLTGERKRGQRRSLWEGKGHSQGEVIILGVD